MHSYNIEEIACHLGGNILSNNKKNIVRNVIPFDKAGQSDEEICWVSDRNLRKLYKLEKGIYIVSEKADVNCVGRKSFIVVKDPRYAFARLMKLFFEEPFIPKIEQTAVISSRALISDDVYICDHVIVEDECRIGSNTKIGYNTVILKNTIIGNNVVIGSNCTIGGVGFGYVRDDNDNYILIPHSGIVRIEDCVEIGNNVAIDRAVLGETIIHYNTKIDNLVHIAHGVTIGSNTIITANVVISGSCCIGDNVWLGPSSVILNKVSIEENAQVGIGSVVIRNIKKDDRVFGNPARSTKNR